MKALAEKHNLDSFMFAYSTAPQPDEKENYRFFSVGENPVIKAMSMMVAMNLKGAIRTYNEHKKAREKEVFQTPFGPIHKN